VYSVIDAVGERPARERQRHFAEPGDAADRLAAPVDAKRSRAGPRQHDMTKLVPYVISCFLDDRSPRLTPGDRYIDWLFARDAAEAFRRALFAPGVEGATIDIASGQRHRVREIVERLFEIVAPPLVNAAARLPLALDLGQRPSDA